MGIRCFTYVIVSRVGEIVPGGEKFCELQRGCMAFICIKFVPFLFKRTLGDVSIILPECMCYYTGAQCGRELDEQNCLLEIRYLQLCNTRLLDVTAAHITVNAVTCYSTRRWKG